MAMNADFDTQMRAAVPEGARAVLLCRSGVRSIAAARRATELGITAYNILEGFEGDADAQGQRGNVVAGAFMACRGSRADSLSKKELPALFLLALAAQRA